jgi:hypothetical protein
VLGGFAVLVDPFDALASCCAAQTAAASRQKTNARYTSTYFFITNSPITPTAFQETRLLFIE